MKPCLPCLGVAALLTLPAALPAADPPPSVGIVREADHVRFTIDGAAVGTYHVGKEWAKPFLWPLIAPNGIAVTRAWPIDKAGEAASTDHVHQKSLWFTHGDVIPEGIDLKTRRKGIEGVDLWTEEPGHGVIACVGVDEPVISGKQGRVATRIEWRSADGDKLLDEVRTIHLLDLGKARLLVFDIDLHASVVPITFGDTKEGAFGLRIADGLREKGGTGRLENADGKRQMAECWGQRSAWCDYSGTLDGKAVGVALFDHPDNPFRSCWHARDYGLMAANPFGRDLSGFPAVKGSTERVRLAKGGHLRLRYGALVHEGLAADADVPAAYRRFVEWKQERQP